MIKLRDRLKKELMEKTLKSEGFAPFVGPSTITFVDKGDVYIRPIKDGVEMVVSQFGTNWDAWLWFERKNEVCLKLAFKVEDFKNLIIQQILGNP